MSIDFLSPDRQPNRLHGIIPPMVTPLAAADQLDFEGLVRVIEHLIAGGVHGLFILGTTGEGPSLSRFLRHQLVELTCEIVAGRVPVLVGVTDTSLTESLSLADQAHAAGASAVVSAPPYYYHATDEELADYFEQLADRSLLPLVLYNMPEHTKISLAPALVSQLSGHENIVALKDSSGDANYLQAALAAVGEQPDFPVLVGPEHLLAQALAMGAAGGVNGGAHVAPTWFVDLFHAHLSGDRQRVDQLQAKIDEMGKRIYEITARPSRYITGLKTALAAMGLCSDCVAPPLLPLEAAERELAARHLQELGLLDAVSAASPAKP